MKNVLLKLQVLIVLLLSINCDLLAQQTEPTQELFHRVMLINWADTLDHDIKAEVKDLFMGLPAKVDGFRTIEIQDVSKSDEGFEQVLILQFTSEDGLKAYENHEDHLRIQEISPPLVSGFSLYEFWRHLEIQERK